MLEEEELYFYMAECARAREELNVKIRAAGYMSFCSFKDYRTFKQFALKSACSAGRYSIVVTENGDIRACARGDQTYGNVLKEPFHKVWARMSEWKDDSHIPVECKWCPVKKYCHIDNTNSPQLGKQIAIYSAYERKWKVYFWTQRLLFRRWVIGMYRNIASLYKAKRKES
jgi:radical SAM protein with 4Fe4S-binding SPASM domain